MDDFFFIHFCRLHIIIHISYAINKHLESDQYITRKMYSCTYDIILRGKTSAVKTLYLLLIWPCFSYRRLVRSSRFPTSNGIVEAPLSKRIGVARSSWRFEKRRYNLMYFVILYNNVFFYYIIYNINYMILFLLLLLS